MARDLVPIKVTIGTKVDGSADYPNFTNLASVDIEWSRYVDVHGSGWLYEKC